jgi:hypothetical protein
MPAPSSAYFRAEWLIPGDAERARRLVLVDDDDLE